MKDFLKALKWGLCFGGLAFLVFGVVLIAFPEWVERIACYILGAALSVFGLVEIITVFTKKEGVFSAARIVPGILALAVGLAFLFRSALLFEILWFFIGLIVLVDGVYKMQYSFELKNAGVPYWFVNFAFSLASLILAVVLMLRPMEATLAMIRLAGWILAVNGIFDLAEAGMLAKNAKTMQRIATVVIEDDVAPDDPLLTDGDK